MTPQETVERALALSRADGCVVIARESSSANLRWAGNTLTTNGVSRSRSLTVIAMVGAGTGTAVGVVSRSWVPEDTLEDLVRAAETAARGNDAAQDAAPLVPRSGDDPSWGDPPQETSIGVFAQLAPDLGAAFDAAGAAGHLLYGYAEHEMDTVYLGTSSGLRLRTTAPGGQLELTGRSPDGSRSAWAGQPLRAGGDAQVGRLAEEVAQRLRWAERRVELDAGRYEAVLPPSAVGDLMLYLYWESGAQDAAEGRTVFSRPGGGTRVGDTLSPVPLTLRSDPALPGLEVTPFVLTSSSSRISSVFDNGLPLGPTDWIRDGKLTSLLSSRSAATAAGLPVAPFVDNLVLEGPDPAGAPDVTELVAQTERGLLLTCLWYIREVDPQTLLLTGLTRDGVFLVENGEVTGAVNNFRFNESPVGLLSRVTAVGRTESTLPREFGDYFRSARMPALRVDGFNMSSVSQAS